MVRSSLSRRVFVMGGDMTKFTGKGDSGFVKGAIGIDEYVKKAVRGALVNTGVKGADVDRVMVGNGFGQNFCNQGHLGAAAVGADAGLNGKPSYRFEAACASGGVAFESAVQAIQAGADVVLVVGVEVQTGKNAAEGGDILATAADYPRQRPIDVFTFPAMFAEKAKAYFEKHPQQVDLDLVALKAMENAKRNPLAHMHENKFTHDKITKAKTFLNNEGLKPYIKLSDCSQVTDGAAAVLVASEKGLEKLGKDEKFCIEVMHVAQTTDNLFVDRDPTALANIKAAATQCYQATGTAPKDIDVAEVHDCFTMAEVMMMEALGFAAPGKGLDLLRKGATQINGEIPVNTGGGLIGFGHPVGATGIKQILEVYRQMKGQCGDYQVKKPINVGMTANMGGDDKTAVVTIFKNTTTDSVAKL